MRIVVIGANGKTGRLFVQAALDAGHEVVAGVRGSNTIAAHPNVTIVPCDATDEHDVRHILAGAEAVVTVIGHVPGSPNNLQTQATQIIVSVMESLGIKRLVSLTGTGVRFHGDRITLIDKLLNGVLGLIDPARIQDGKEHAQLIKSTDLDWTIIRVLKLTNSHRSSFKLSLHGPAKTLVSRESTAQAILHLLEKNTYVRQSPIVSK